MRLNANILCICWYWGHLLFLGLTISWLAPLAGGWARGAVRLPLPLWRRDRHLGGGPGLRGLGAAAAARAAAGGACWAARRAGGTLGMPLPHLVCWPSVDV